MTSDLVARLGKAVGSANVLSGDAIPDDYAHDEALTATPVMPLAVVRPATAMGHAAGMLELLVLLIGVIPCGRAKDRPRCSGTSSHAWPPPF